MVPNTTKNSEVKKSTKPLENISGLVERVTYHNLDNGFCVLRLQVRGRKDLTTLVGHLASITPGEFIHASGYWRQDKQHGLQFGASHIKATPPTSIEGITKYLASGLIKGIGPIYAEKLVKAFGDGVFDVIENEPLRLQDEVEGIGPGRKEKIIKGWAEQKCIREIMLFLHSHQISTARAVRIYKTYGSDAINVITNNPYKLAQDIRGIGFISSDKIASSMGIDKDSIIRAKAGIIHTLSTALDEGNCGLPKELLVKKAISLLEITDALAKEAIDLVVQSGEVIEENIRDTECVLLKGLASAEKGIAERVFALQMGILPWGEIEIEGALAWVEDKTNVKLSNSQREAIEKILHTKIAVITGGPGVGKTTLVNSIIQILKARKIKIALAAPTGRAAKRLSEVTQLEASTLHRLLKVNMTEGGAIKNEQYPLERDVVIVDEVSMIDVPLMYSLLKAIPPTTALILVGDVDQLPSVGPGQVLYDIIKSDVVRIIRLTEIFRQALDSKIVSNAHRINQSLMPIFDTSNNTYTAIDDNHPSSNTTANLVSDFYFIEVSDAEKALATILRLIVERIPKKFKYDPIKDIQILCPMSRGIVGTRNLNVELQKLLNKSENQPVERFGNLFREGDKVMQIENNYDKDVFNGDTGFITYINHEEQELTIRYEDKEVKYDFNELDQIILSYAITIHKSQGSEYQVVVIPIMMQHYTMLQKNLIYTAITRGKKLVVMVGEKKALKVALHNKKNSERWSSLQNKLNEVIAGF